jgi:alanine racemase
MQLQAPARVLVELDSHALINNYRMIQDLVPDQEILPMVKANAYGHGVQWVAQHLSSLSGLYGFGVATLDEGAELRQILVDLGPRSRKLPIIVFSDAAPWSEEKGDFCEFHALTPVIHSENDWVQFRRGGWADRLSYELQFNTGMNRMGLAPSFVSTLIRDLKNVSAEHQPSGISSHLAMSEAPDSKLSQTQLQKFKWIREELSSFLPRTRFHLANSGGIWNHSHFQLKKLTDGVRPGLSLYGIPPWQNAPTRGILPVLTYKAQVVFVHRLKQGESIGYGGIYKVKGSEPVYAAVLGAGYADGVHRSLSNQGHAWLGGKSTRFLGVVSMDLCAIQATEKTQVGEWAELMGPHVDPWAQAKSAATIPYEILTSISSRVKRIYDAK